LRTFFENGYGISVIPRSLLRDIFAQTDQPDSWGLASLYNDTVEMFEAVILTGDHHESQIVYDTPLNHQDSEFILNSSEVDELMEAVRALPKQEIS